MNYEEVLFKARFYCEHIPNFMQRYATKRFMKLRSAAANIFNNFIDEVNSEWDKTGEEAGLGSGFNPKYAKLIKDRIQPIIDKDINSRSGAVCIFIGDDCDLHGRIKFIKDSKISLGLIPIEKKT